MSTAGEDYILNTQIKDYMINNAKEHVDQSGIVSMTNLAEACANDLHNEAADDIHFEIAHQVAEELELL